MMTTANFELEVGETYVDGDGEKTVCLWMDGDYFWCVGNKTSGAYYNKHGKMRHAEGIPSLTLRKK